MSEGGEKKKTALSPKLQLLGRAYVLQLHMVLRTMRIHDPTNKALLIATENLKTTINTLWAALDGSVRLHFVEGLAFLNDVRLRLDAGVTQQVRQLQKEFEERDFGGMVFTRPVDSAALREFMVRFSRHVEGEDDVRSLKESLLELHDLALELLGPQQFGDGGPPVEELRIDRKTFALQSYAKTIIAMREFIEAMKRGEEPATGKIRLTRIVQDLVDIATERVNFLLRMSNIKQAHAYAYNHAANTCVLSIVIGRALEVDRLALVDLGTSALFADVGFALLPEGTLDQAAEFTTAERADAVDTMVRQIRAIIGSGDVSEAMMRRVIVAYEHHLPYRDPASGAEVRTHLFSRVVAVADAFDALTTRRPWREGYTADEALKILMEESGRRYDPLVVKILVNLMGMYPLGSAVFLDSGELALVYHNSTEPELFERPWVKIIRDKGGSPVRRTLIRNLAEHDGLGSRIVARATRADLEGVDAGTALVL